MPRRQPKRGRLRLGDGSRVRLRPERPNHVWAYDFVQDRTHDGRVLRMLVVVDEFTPRECLAIRVDRRLDSDDVLAVLAELFVRHGGPPEHVRSDNGPEFAAKAVRTWLGRLGTRALFIEPGSPLGDLLIAVPAGTDRQLRWRWENGHCESFNGKLRDELLDREIFYTLEAARLLVEAWRHHHNTARPHSALGYGPPAPEAVAWPTSALHLLPAGHGSRVVYH